MATSVSSTEMQDALAAVGASFEPGELPFLALTSKPEGAIRDRLAWALAKTGRRVTREWRERRDLAVLDGDGEPLAVLESKASYTHDTAWSMSRSKLDGLHQAVGGATRLRYFLRCAM